MPVNQLRTLCTRALMPLFACAFFAGHPTPVLASDAVKSLQVLLNERKCHTGTPDGLWGARTQNAVDRFSTLTGIEIARPIDQAVVDRLVQTDALCPFELPEQEVLAESFRLEHENSVRGPDRGAQGTERFFLIPGECKAGHKSKSANSALGALTDDCNRNRQRSEMRTTAKVSHGARRIYLWDMMVPEDFRSTATDDHLIVGQFHSGYAPSSTFSLSQEQGYFINGKECFGPEAFGSWQTVAVRVHWHSKRKKGLRDKTPGIFEVWCNGKLIWDRSGRPNVAQGDGITFKYGLYHAKDFPADDYVTVSFRNARVIKW